MKISKRFASKYQNGGSPSNQEWEDSYTQGLDWLTSNPNVYATNLSASRLADKGQFGGALGQARNAEMIQQLADKGGRRYYIDPEVSKVLMGMRLGDNNLTKEQRDYIANHMRYDLIDARDHVFDFRGSKGQTASYNFGDNWHGTQPPPGMEDLIKRAITAANRPKYPKVEHEEIDMKPSPQQLQDIQEAEKVDADFDKLVEIPEEKEEEEKIEYLTTPSSQEGGDTEFKGTLMDEEKITPSEQEEETGEGKSKYPWMDEFSNIMSEREKQKKEREESESFEKEKQAPITLSKREPKSVLGEFKPELIRKDKEEIVEEEYSPQSKMTQEELDKKAYGESGIPQSVLSKWPGMDKETEFDDGGLVEDVNVDLTDVWDTDNENMNIFGTPNPYGTHSGAPQAMGGEKIFPSRSTDSGEYVPQTVRDKETGQIIASSTTEGDDVDGDDKDTDGDDIFAEDKDAREIAKEKLKAKQKNIDTTIVKKDDDDDDDDGVTKFKGSLSHTSALAKEGSYISKYFSGGDVQDGDPSFAEAFSKALKEGEEYFLWRGKEYKVDLKEPGSEEQAFRIGWDEEKISKWMDLLEEEKLKKQNAE